MGKRGPTPGHERVRALPGREERRPPPPEGLTDGQARLWRGITESEPASLFEGEARQHMLRLYVEHAAFRAEVQGLIDRTPVDRMVDPEAAPAFEAMLKARDRETKTLVSLATRLRLTNQARYTPQAAGTAGRQHATSPRPWDDSPAAEFFNW